jgi:hypothetical protein
MTLMGSPMLAIWYIMSWPTLPAEPMIIIESIGLHLRPDY